MQNGQIQGTVTSDANNKPLAGVTVMVNGPALQGDQVEVTDADGRYQITQLPSGDDYVVRFYLGDTVVERPGVRIGQNKTLSISVAMPMKQMTKEVKVIRERAPNLDTATSNSGVEINEDVMRNTAVRGRTFESVLALAPGTVDPPRGQGGDIGVSISGSTGNENNFIVDGLNTGDPNTGVIGTELHQAFIKEVNIITGGYQAEYGRATGGIVSIVTKSGSNELHGSIFGSIQPFQLQPSTVGRLGEALALRRKSDGLTYDYGFELGGAIVKDRIWFYVGFAPTTTVAQNDRIIRAQNLDPSTGQAQQLTDYQCPTYLATDLYCRGGRALARATTEIPDRTTHYDETKRLYNGIAKLQFNITPDHNIQIGYVGSPSTFSGFSGLGQSQSENVDDLAYTSTSQVHDATARYVGKFLDRRLQVDLLYGFHYQSLEQTPKNIDKAWYRYLTDASNPYSLADFEDVPECRRSSATGFNPCPVTQYDRNGFGQYNNTKLQRHQALAAVTYFLNALGSHAFKLGFDFEHLSNDNFRTYSGTDQDPNDPSTGHVLFQTSADGQRLRNFAEYSTIGPNGETQLVDGFHSVTSTNNYALYLRDSWNISKLPGLVLNLGVRWEVQELSGADGTKQIGIYDNIAPRIGAVWDFTRKGLSKLYVNYGRFYESLPLTINDRQFSGEGVFTGAETTGCPTMSLQPGGRALPTATGATLANCNLNSLTADGANQNGGRYGNVMPNLKGQYLDEVVAGINYDVGWDLVLGVGYIYRSLGNIVEDMSVDGGTNYIIGNPGVTPDPDQIAKLQAQVQSLQSAPQTPANQDALQRVQAQLDAYKTIGRLFPKAKRVYNALVITANKRLSNRFGIIANYTYSRMIGNYPGTYDGTADENLPNFSSQYDLTDLLANRNGPLPNDRPHNLKLLGTYQQPIGTKGTLTIGLTFSAYSGRPINVLGAHPIYGASQVFILPRGSGGRTPMVSQFDLHVGYDHKFGKRITLSVFADVINLFDQHQVTNVDDDYTYSSVSPVVNGKPDALLHLKDISGAPVVLNSNYGQPTGYQAPLYMRFGARMAF